MRQQKRLLIVDDDEMNRDMLSRRLLRAGYDVRLAEGGKEALDILAREAIDLVLLDLMMPEISGLDVLDKIRATRPASEFPVIIVTANNDSSGVVTAVRAGANDYITKPIDLALAQARIEAALGQVVDGRERQRRLELYRLASVAAEEGLWDWNLRTRTVDYSAGWKAMLGYDSTEIGNCPDEWFTRIHPEDRGRVIKEVRTHLQGQTAHLLTEYRMRHKDGTWRWLENRAGADHDHAGVPIRLGGCHTDITSRKTIDPLTSLFNRAWLECELRSLEDRRSPAALLLFALDDFERLEDSLPDGGAGPFLAALAGVMRSLIESEVQAAGASLVRSADHELAVLLPRRCSEEEAERLASRIQAALNTPIILDGHPFTASASIGMALSSKAEPVHSLLLNAHAAMRHARDLGPRRAELYHHGMREQELEELRIEADLRRSLDEHAFVIHYQPKVAIEDGSIRGFEALLRWRRSSAGLVQPDHFIPLAERTGLIVAIGKQVLEQACLDTAELRRRHPHVTVSVNVSGRQFADPALVDHVRHALEISGLHPATLRLEITETAVMSDPQNALIALQSLRDLGVGLKLDDFGTGYSSLTYLHQFPVDTLKIDRSFVMRLPGAGESVAIVRAILTLARSLQMDVVAEGIENRRQAELLRYMGCQYGQGYWYSRPVDLPTLRELLAVKFLPRMGPEQTAAVPISQPALLRTS